MPVTTRLGAFAGMLAAISMTASPAAAAELTASPVSGGSAYSNFDHSAYDGDYESAERHRWRRHGWYDYHRHRRVDAGDVIAGVLILGGIAAIANAASRDRDYRYRDRDYRYRDYRDYRDRDDRYRDYRDDYRRDQRPARDSGLDSAVDQCVDRIERDRRVETVDGVNRTSDGWVVVGDLASGVAFTCRIGNDGRIADIDYDGASGANYSPASQNQWSDERYREARRAAGVQSPDAESDPRPAYPGGPLPGEEYAEEVDGDIGG